VEGSCEHGNELSCSIKCWEIIEWLSDWAQLYRVSYVSPPSAILDFHGKVKDLRIRVVCASVSQQVGRVPLTGLGG
jgi:hypothetical protein